MPDVVRAEMKTNKKYLDSNLIYAPVTRIEKISSILANEDSQRLLIGVDENFNQFF